MKYVIISNRLPVSLLEKNDEFITVRSNGGLATGLDSLETRVAKHWLGWPGLHVESESEQRTITAALSPQLLHPVYLTPSQIEDYYEGYSNSTLWPLCHYFFSYITYDEKYWKAYREVNELFCVEALKIIEPGDMVWIHDYQLMLLPAMIRERMPDVGIGYFHHIPFPSYELFRCLPERADILRGLLGADLVAFHVHDYMRHFISALYRVLNLDCKMDEVHLDNRVAAVEAYPMGINYGMFHDRANTPEVLSLTGDLRQLAGENKMILSVDRLDYSKGILLRLKSFTDFLEHNPEYRGKVTLVMIIVPSRDNVGMYAELKVKIDEMCGALNGAYAAVGWTPVHYFYRSFSIDELTAMYNIADIALITPLRDGMNLVAKEYLAAKRDRPGVLILSEMAGAAVELPQAIIVNPTDTKQIEAAIVEALNMPEEEQLAALGEMQKTIARQSVGRWAKDFLSDLQKAKLRNDELKARILGQDDKELCTAFNNAKKRLLVLDYDGTLAPFVKNPAKAFPSPELLELLRALARDSRNTVVVSSGRDRSTIEQWLGGLGIGLAAEHGAFFKENGIWHGCAREMHWEEGLLGILEHFTDKTPRSRLETKTTSLVWHFREVDPWLADLRGTQLINALIAPGARLGLQIMRGNKIVEIKSSDFTKGTEIKRLLEKESYDFILAIGDDTTDDDMFAALPPEAVSIKVGQFSAGAKYCIPYQSQVLPFLTGLLSPGTERHL